MNPSEDPSDRLVDSLLKEQSRGKADEDLLRSIEEMLHDTGGRVRRRRCTARIRRREARGERRGELAPAAAGVVEP